jgi:7-carboxy-7-deazaguanine synthase
MDKRMKIFSVFHSFDGECNYCGQGHLTTFVRFAGCNSKCTFCDTKKAIPLDSGKETTIDELVAQVEQFGKGKLTITGGEPLLQIEELTKFLSHPMISYRDITVETNGTIPIPNEIYQKAKSWIVDCKPPSSGVQSDPTIFEFLGPADYIKFVIFDEEDYKFAVDIVKKYDHLTWAIWAFSPAVKYLRNIYNPYFPTGRGFFDSEFSILKILTNLLTNPPSERIVLNLQLHKLISGFKEEE